jgi:hypothetical protein
MRSVVLLSVLLLGPAIAADGSGSSESTLDLSQPEFNFMGFADVSYVSKDNSNLDGFVIGQAVAHMSASLGQSLSAF